MGKWTVLIVEVVPSPQQEWLQLPAFAQDAAGVWGECECRQLDEPSQAVLMAMILRCATFCPQTPDAEYFTLSHRLRLKPGLRFVAGRVMDALAETARQALGPARPEGEG